MRAGVCVCVCVCSCVCVCVCVPPLPPLTPPILWGSTAESPPHPQTTPHPRSRKEIARPTPGKNYPLKSARIVDAGLWIDQSDLCSQGCLVDPQRLLRRNSVGLAKLLIANRWPSVSAMELSQVIPQLPVTRMNTNREMPITTQRAPSAQETLPLQILFFFFLGGGGGSATWNIRITK